MVEKLMNIIKFILFSKVLIGLVGFFIIFLIVKKYKEFRNYSPIDEIEEKNNAVEIESQKKESEE